MRSEAEELAKMMVKYGLTHVKVGDVELRRPDAAVFAALMDDEKRKKKGSQPEPDEVDELQRLMNLTPDAVDAALRLEPLAKVGT